MTLHLTEKLSKLSSLDRKYGRPQNCPFQSSFTQNCAVHSGNPTVSCVASKQQTRALFLSTMVTRTRIHTELTNLLGNLCCAREHSVQFFIQFFTQLPAQFNLGCMGPLMGTGMTGRRLSVYQQPTNCLTG